MRVFMSSSLVGLLGWLLCAVSWWSTSDAAHVLKETVNHALRPDYAAMRRAGADRYHQMVFVIKQNNLDVVEGILYDVSSVSSPNYGRYKTFDEIGALVENVEATEAVASWLREHRVKIVSQSTYGEFITASAAVSVWEELLHTTFHEYHKIPSISTMSGAAAARSYAVPVVRTESYSLPDYLVDHVHTIFYSIDLPPRTKPRAALRRFDRDQVVADPDTTTSSYVTPSKLYSMYGITGTGNGYGSQAVYESLSQTFLASDLASFQKTYGLANDPVDYYIGPVPSGTICNSNANDCGEASLDVQYILAVGQDVPTTYWYDNSSDGSFLTFLTNISNTANPVNIYSISYSSYEVDISLSILQAFDTEAMKLGARGVTLVASAGDDGVAGFEFYSSLPISQCGYYAQWPASSPYVTAVGGTMNGEALTNTPEIVCSSSTGSGITSGGGFSNSIPAPAFQKSAIKSYLAQYHASQSSYQAYNSSNRGYPDVAMAANGYLVTIGGATYVEDGTSASAPVFAGIVALVNAYRIQHGLSAIGWVNPAIYSNNGGFTNDITSGNNNCTKSSSRCCSIGFEAKTGWDPTSGFGSVNYAQFLSYFQSISSFPTYAPTTSPVVSTATPTSTVTAKPSAVPTRAPTATPTTAPTAVPTAKSTVSPTATRTTMPSPSPSVTPTHITTVAPSATPSTQPVIPSTPTAVPTLKPSITIVPIALPTPSPTFVSTVQAPTSLPIHLPTVGPSSSLPTTVLSLKPTAVPTKLPTAVSPTSVPTIVPTIRPTFVPTAVPGSPTHQPSAHPTPAPTKPKPPPAKVSFTISQTFTSEATADEISSDPSAAQEFAAIVWEIFSNDNVSAVTINGIFSVSSESSSSSSNSRRRHRRRSLFSMKSSLFSNSYQVGVNYTTSFVEANADNITAITQSLQSNVTAQLNVSVISGQFTTMLQTSNCSVLSSMVSTVVPAVPPPIVVYVSSDDTTSSSSSSSSGVSGAEIGGIVAGVLGFFFIAGGIGGYIWYSKGSVSSSTSSPTSSSSPTAKSASSRGDNFVTKNPLGSSLSSSSKKKPTSPTAKSPKRAPETSDVELHNVYPEQKIESIERSSLGA